MPSILDLKPSLRHHSVECLLHTFQIFDRASCDDEDLTKLQHRYCLSIGWDAEITYELKLCQLTLPLAPGGQDTVLSNRTKSRHISVSRSAIFNINARLQQIHLSYKNLHPDGSIPAYPGQVSLCAG